jgi:hypothetical protein
MTWILVLMVLGLNGQALDHIRFTSEAACDRARSKFIEQGGDVNLSVVSFCVHDGEASDADHPTPKNGSKR